MATAQKVWEFWDYFFVYFVTTHRESRGLLLSWTSAYVVIDSQVGCMQNPWKCSEFTGGAADQEGDKMIDG